jgi:chromate reductase, NAD(P)H dehydrogenase (quinone)
MKLLAFSGSMRKGSVNGALMKLAIKIAKDEGCTVELINLSDFDMPLYNGDIEEKKGVPQGALDLKEKMEGADAVIISSPEYNFSVPGTLKNAIDWVSRTKPQPFKGKNMLLMSASPSMVGGNRGLWALRVPLEALGAFVYPEMFSLALAYDAFTDDGSLKDKELAKTLQNNVKGFIKTLKKSN